MAVYKNLTIYSSESRLSENRCFKVVQLVETTPTKEEWSLPKLLARAKENIIRVTF